ncbi:MAG: class I SAM-dependent methyltransferase, partial [Peptostreptococcus sp.]|nr:class I SAM-dependent methyltransferase [Peptostreptococcus sp.]
MDQYGNFAYIYDQLMDDVDYEAWVEHIEKLIAISGANVKNILELACGTGNITLPLARKEYDIAGLDISEEMLDVAREKSELENIPLVLLQQDMTQLDFDLYDLDCILCACDGINYITDLEDVKNLFGKVYELLKKEGIFIFDIS